MEEKALKMKSIAQKCRITKTLGTMCTSFVILYIYYIHTSPTISFHSLFSARKIFQKKNEDAEMSTCSVNATQRGSHQNVISFSFYGDPNDPRGYFSGIEVNARVMTKLYPGWVMRVYHDVPASDALNTTLKLNELQEKYKDILDTCFVGDLPQYGNIMGSQQNMWRFLTLSDPLVDVTIFRDLDSTLNEREKAAVEEWLGSNYTMHIMRDHPYHLVKILAGMWGVKLNSGYRELWNKITNDLIEDGMEAGAKGKDQESLANIVWPLGHKEYGFVMQHDSYSCNKPEFSSVGGMRHFPECRDTTKGLNFVGSRRSIDVKPLILECPTVCRLQEQCIHC